MIRGISGGARSLAALVTMMGILPVLGAASSVGAHDHEPPIAVFRQSRDRVQEGRLGSSCWTRKKPNGTFERYCGTTGWNWPDHRSIVSGNRSRIRVFKRQAPSDFKVSIWRRITENDRPVGEPNEPRLETRRVVTPRSKVRHDIIFRLPEGTRDLFIRAVGYWRDTEGSNQVQDAAWTFRLRP